MMTAAAVSSSSSGMNLKASSSSVDSKHTLTVNHVLQRCRMSDPAHVRRMNVCGSSLEDINVMHNFINVEVCSLSANDVSDLEALRSCSRLQELYLRKNRIVDFTQVLHLSHLPIRHIGLSENPIALHPHYRKFVISALPQLQKLDEVQVSVEERREAERDITDPFAAAMEFGIANAPPMAGRPGSSHGNPAASSSPVHAATAATGGSGNNMTLAQRRQQARVAAAATNSSSEEKQDNSASPFRTSAPKGFNNTTTDESPNRYNGDDIPVGSATAAPPSRTSAPSINNNNNNSKIIKARRGGGDPFSSSDVIVGGVGAGGAASSAFSSSSSYDQVAANSRLAPQEEASVNAVKLLLSAMSPAALAHVKRHLVNL
jgi:cilla- and flagella-associated protein